MRFVPRCSGQFEEGVIELDEENHFNRYRLSTLFAASYTADTFPGLDLYRNWCSKWESHCQTHGGYWTNDSAEREFGPPGDRGHRRTDRIASSQAVELSQGEERENPYSFGWCRRTVRHDRTLPVGFRAA